MRSILLFPRVARCRETIYDCVGVCVNVCCVEAVVKDSCY